MIGERLGHFRIVEQLGRGGMGVVYRAQDETLGRAVALKVLPPEFVEDAERRDRFLREARVAASVTHPHIATIYEAGVAQGTVFIAMELVEGPTLRALLQKRPLPPAQALRIAIQIAEGLAKAHESGVVHRDLKPENVVVTPEGHVKVLDFGLAKLVEQRDAATASELSGAETATGELTVRGEILGTPTYMSPEQARGRTVDSRSDVFSFGSTLYEMVTGRPPFQGPTKLDMLSAILEKEPVPPSEIAPGIAGELDRIISRCLCKAPEQRYNDTRDLVAALRDLERVELGTPVSSAPGAGKEGRETRQQRRRGILIAAGALVVLLGIALLLPQVRDLVGIGRGPAADRLVLAVLFFDNLGSSQDDHLAAGLTEDIITSLSQIGSLGVLSRHAVERYRGRAVDPRSVGKDLGVGYVLEGSVRRIEQSLRVTAQLIDAREGTHVWANRYDGSFDDVFAMQDTIAAGIVDALRIRIAPEEVPLVSRRWTANTQAYAYFLIGREAFWDDKDPQRCSRGQPWFEKALALDPDYAPALAYLANCIGCQRIAEDLVRPGGLTRALELARRARALDPSLALAWRAEGLVLRAMNRYTGAQEAFQRAIELNPQLSEAYAAMATNYREMGRWEEARLAYRRGIEADPYFRLCYSMLVELYQERGEFDEALGVVAEGLHRLPEQANLLMSKCRIIRMQGRFSEAVEECRKVVAAHPDNWGAYWQIGTALRQSGRVSESDSVFALLQEKWPNAPNVVSWVGWHELQRRRYGRAEERFRRALELDEDHFWARVNLAFCLGRQGRLEEGEKAILQLAERLPDDAEACRQVANFYKDESKDYDEAEKWAKRAVERAPEWEAAYNVLGQVYEKLGEHDKAAAAYEAAVKARPNADWDHRSLAQALAQLGRFPEAIKAAERAVELRPDQAGGFITLGWVQRRMGKRHQAAAAYEKALELDPENQPALTNLANVYGDEGRFEKQIEMLRRAAGLDTTAAYPWLGIAGTAFFLLHDFALARDAAQAGLQRATTSSDSARARTIWAVAEERQGNARAAKELHREATRSIERAIEQAPENPGVLRSAAMIYARAGDAARARRYLDRTVGSITKSPDELYNLACIMAILGDRDRAIEYLRKAVDAGYENKPSLQRDLDLDNIRDDPRFAGILDSIR